MKKVKESDSAIGGINVVPIIDVCLVLLVILFIMTPVLNLDSLPVNLPEAMTKETKEQNLTISMGADGRISVDQAVVTEKTLPREIHRALADRKNVVLVVRADKDLPYGTVENLIRLVNRYAGDNAVAIATKQRSTPLGVTKQ